MRLFVSICFSRAASETNLPANRKRRKNHRDVRRRSLRMSGQIPNRAEPASSNGAIEADHTFQRSDKFQEIVAATCGMYGTTSLAGDIRP